VQCKYGIRRSGATAAYVQQMAAGKSYFGLCTPERIPFSSTRNALRRPLDSLRGRVFGGKGEVHPYPHAC
jgi:hypothetical protein